MRISSSTAAALEPRDHGSRFVWRAVSLFVAACLIILGARYLINDAIPFLTDISSGKFGRFWPRRVWLLTHIAASGIALLAGPFQFWSGLRQHSMLVHRWSGRLYVGVLPSLGCDPSATLVWLSWSMPLLATEVILQGRKVMARRGRCLTTRLDVGT